MLVLYRRDEGVASIDLAETTLLPEVAWIYLLGPIQGEIAFVERVTHLSLPSFEDLSEIEA